MSQNTQILTPVGRFVQGDAFIPQDKDAEGRPLLVRTGANVGQPRVLYYIAIAIPKTAPEWGELWGKIHAEAMRSFPDLFNAGVCSNPSFAFKVTDGDSTTGNRKGKRPCDNEGFPGSWVLHFSGSFPPNVFQRGGQELVTSPDAVKRGYWIRILGNVVGNKSGQMPGVFLNPSNIEFMGYDTEIIVGPDGSAFAENPVGTLPAGVSETPLAPAGAAPGVVPPMPGMAPPAAVPPMPMGAVAPGAVPPMPGMAPPASSIALVAGTAPSVPGAAPVVQPAPDFLNPAAVFTFPDGQQFTRAQLLQAGYTETQITALPPF